MRIREVEAAVGITRKNIRFYEDEGLLKPRREAENGYRDYCKEDVDALMRIKLLRSLDVPIESIRRLQSGELALSGCLELHETALERQRENIARMKEMCAELRAKGAEYGALDVTESLSRMEHMREEGVKFMDVKTKDRAKKLRGSIIGGAVMVALMAGVITLGAYALADGMPKGMLLLFWLVPAIVIAGVVAALVQRMKEIKGGEEDEASKY